MGVSLAEEDDQIGSDYRPNRAQRRAAGYVRQRKIYKLVFEGEEMAGLEVRAGSVPLGTLMELSGYAGVFDRDSASLGPEEVQAIKRLFKAFAEALVSWNLEDPIEETGETRPVPTTVEGLYTLDMDFALAVVNAWMEAMAGASGPLGRPSSGGKPSLEASLPMATSSPSPAS